MGNSGGEPGPLVSRRQLDLNQALAGTVLLNRLPLAIIVPG
jgi:hypothetical protein